MAGELCAGQGVSAVRVWLAKMELRGWALWGGGVWAADLCGVWNKIVRERNVGKGAGWGCWGWVVWRGVGGCVLIRIRVGVLNTDVCDIYSCVI